MTLAALPRSRLHLQFLVANGAEPDVVFYRDGFMAADIETAYPARGIDLGRETVPGRHPLSLIRARRHNRTYYAGLEPKLAALGVDRLILFLEGEPLERYLCGLPAIRHVELWEDGLSHYVDLTGNAWYAARGLVQAACGFYPERITRRRMDRSKVLIRDRFEHRNLVLPSPPAGEAERDEFLLIGSPLVEDRIVPRSRFVRALAEIAGALPVPVRYLPHPRESRARLGEDAAKAGVIVEGDTRGLFAHAQSFGYRAYGAAVSTGLLDLGRFDRSAFMPGVFGLRKMEATLAGWRHNPVEVVRNLRRLRDLAGGGGLPWAAAGAAAVDD